MLVFIVSFANYWWGIFKSKEEKSSIKRFLKKFDTRIDSSEYQMMLEDKNIPVETIILLALSYERVGDYEKAIGIYLYALKKINSKDEKQYVLSLLGKTYFKAGFLKRARDIFLDALKLYPRNEESLKYLTVVYEKLKSYSKAREVLDALEELGADVSLQKNYIEALDIVSSEDMTSKTKEKQLLELIKTDSFVERVFFEYLLKSGKKIDLDKIKDFDFNAVLDILWYLDEEYFNEDIVKKNRILSEVATARGISQISEGSLIYEMDIVIKLNRAGHKIADLSFEYLCSECKHLFPLYFYRCPNCHSIATAAIEPVITKKDHEENISF